MPTPEEALGPLAEVAALYEAGPRAHPFRARNRDEWALWREALRDRLAGVLAIPADHAPLVPEVVERVEAEGYSRELVFLRAAVGGVPVHVLRPAGPGPFLPVIAVHGHGPGVRELVGVPGEVEEEPIANPHTAFAVSLVRRGFLVFAPEQLGFGARREAEDAALGSMASSCRQASLALLLLGHPMLGLRVRDLYRTLAFIAVHADVRSGGVGGVGFASGGTALLYAAALEDRFAALVLSGCLATYRQSIMAINHCEDNYLPGILRYAEMTDIAALLAPRPLFVESGLDDPIFPASSTLAVITQIRKAYAILGAADRLDMEVFSGGHQFHGVRSLDWLARWL